MGHILTSVRCAPDDAETVTVPATATVLEVVISRVVATGTGFTATLTQDANPVTGVGSDAATLAGLNGVLPTCSKVDARPWRGLTVSLACDDGVEAVLNVYE